MRDLDTGADDLTQSGYDTCPPARRGDSADALASVSNLAQELGITARTLRFYEDKGLISPARVGAARVYASRERARMIVILRGKRLGFSLREIKAYLDLYDADPRHEIQRRALIEKITEKRRQLEARRCAIDEALDGLDDLERDAGVPSACKDTTTDP